MLLRAHTPASVSMIVILWRTVFSHIKIDNYHDILSILILIRIIFQCDILILILIYFPSTNAPPIIKYHFGHCDSKIEFKSFPHRPNLLILSIFFTEQLKSISSRWTTCYPLLSLLDLEISGKWKQSKNGLSPWARLIRAMRLFLLGISGRTRYAKQIPTNKYFLFDTLNSPVERP